MNALAEPVYAWTTNKWPDITSLKGGVFRGIQAVPQSITLPYATLEYEPEPGERDSGVDMDYVVVRFAVLSRTPDEASRFAESWNRWIESAGLSPLGGRTVGVESMGPPACRQEDRDLWVAEGVVRFQTQFDRTD